MYTLIAPLSYNNMAMGQRDKTAFTDYGNLILYVTVSNMPFCVTMLCSCCFSEFMLAGSLTFFFIL